MENQSKYTGLLKGKELAKALAVKFQGLVNKIEEDKKNLMIGYDELDSIKKHHFFSGIMMKKIYKETKIIAENKMKEFNNEITDMLYDSYTPLSDSYYEYDEIDEKVSGIADYEKDEHTTKEMVDLRIEILNNYENQVKKVILYCNENHPQKDTSDCVYDNYLKNLISKEELEK